jgi:hypothetical protein
VLLKVGAGSRAVRQHHDSGSGASGESDRPAGQYLRKVPSVRRVREQILYEAVERQTDTAQPLGGDHRGEGRLRLPPAERAVRTRAGDRYARAAVTASRVRCCVIMKATLKSVANTRSIRPQVKNLERQAVLDIQNQRRATERELFQRGRHHDEPVSAWISGNEQESICQASPTPMNP